MRNTRLVAADSPRPTIATFTVSLMAIRLEIVQTLFVKSKVITTFVVVACAIQQDNPIIVIIRKIFFMVQALSFYWLNVVFWHLLPSGLNKPYIFVFIGLPKKP